MLSILPRKLRRLCGEARWWWAAFAAWFVVLFILSSFSFKTDLPAPTHFDKVAHFGYFFGGGFALGAALLLRGMAPVQAGILTIVSIALIGAFDEWHQTLTPGRMGLDPWDWTADLLGGMAGFAVVSRIFGGRNRDIAD